MARSQLDLMPGEKMVMHSHPHWWFFWKQAAGGLVVVLLLIMTSAVSTDWLSDVLWFITVIALIVWVVNTIYQFVQWRTTQFAVTDQRVAYQSGVIRRSGVSIPLNRVNNVNFDQSMIARMLNNGIVIVESAGETGDSVFENIPDPESVRSLIFGQVEADETADSERDAAALARILKEQNVDGPAAQSAQDRLKELEGLHAQGLVSDDEFEVKRKQILDDL
ncbi:MAG: PH domain-containing protein [Actinobacteria bacterium]|nr:PH domain-containing protein [Actinomycetota bacterium]